MPSELGIFWKILPFSDTRSDGRLGILGGDDDPTEYRKMVKFSEKFPNFGGNVLTVSHTLVLH